MLIRTSLKLSYFCQKNTKFSSAGGSASKRQCLRWLRVCPQTPSPSNSPPCYCRFLTTRPILDICFRLDTKTLVMKVPCRHFFLKSQANVLIISQKKENTKIRKSMPNYELMLTKVLRALVSTTHS